MFKLPRATAFILALILPALAWAQGSILQGGLAPPGHVPMYTGPSSAATVLGDSGSADGTCPGGALGCGLSEFLQVNRAPGVGPFGSHVALYDAPTTGPYHWLTLDANPNGAGALLTIGAGGGAAPLPFTCNINGTIQSCLTSAITPPLFIFESLTGPIVNDGAVITAGTVSSPTAQQIYNQSVFAANGTIFQSSDALRGVNVANPLSTVNTITGVAGYTLNNTVPIGQRSQTIGVFADAICAANGTQCWGVDSITSDNPTLGNSGVTAGTGKFLYNEFDLNITSPNTGGAILQLGGTALPSSITLGIPGINLKKLWGSGGMGTGTALLSYGLFMEDACCAVAESIGVTALSGVDVKSMPVNFNYRDHAGNIQNITLTGFSANSGNSGTLFVGGSGASQNFDILNGSLFLASGTGISFNNNSAISSDGTSTINVGTAGSPWTALGLGNASTTVTIQGSTIGVGSTGATVNIASGAGVDVVNVGGANGAVAISGSVTAPNLPTQAHAGSNACLGYNAATKAIYVSSTVTTC